MMRTLFKKGLPLFIAIVLTVIFMREGVRHTMLSVFLFIQKPFAASAEYIMQAQSSIRTHIQSKEALQKENERLLQETERLSIEISRDEDFKKDYALLLETIGQPPDAGIIARVIMTPKSQSFGTMTVNKGTEDGIVINMKAILQNEILIGFVEEVFAHSSRIRLLSSFNTETQLKIGESQSTVLAVGKGNGMLSILLPRDFPVRAGERLIFADTRPLLAGFIDTVKNPEAEATIAVEAITPFNPATISIIVLHQ